MDFNEMPFEHTSKNGTIFKAKRNDLQSGVVVKLSENLSSLKELISDSVEMAAWHAMNIRPSLTQFNGYDTVRYSFVEVNDEIKIR